MSQHQADQQTNNDDYKSPEEQEQVQENQRISNAELIGEDRASNFNIPQTQDIENQRQFYESHQEIRASTPLEKNQTTAEVIVVEDEKQQEKGGQYGNLNQGNQDEKEEKEETGGGKGNSKKNKKKKNNDKNKNAGQANEQVEEQKKLDNTLIRTIEETGDIGKSDNTLIRTIPDTVVGDAQTQPTEQFTAAYEQKEEDLVDNNRQGEQEIKEQQKEQIQYQEPQYQEPQYQQPQYREPQYQQENQNQEPENPVENPVTDPIQGQVQYEPEPQISNPTQNYDQVQNPVQTYPQSYQVQEEEKIEEQVQNQAHNQAQEQQRDNQQYIQAAQQEQYRAQQNIHNQNIQQNPQTQNIGYNQQEQQNQQQPQYDQVPPKQEQLNQQPLNQDNSNQQYYQNDHDVPEQNQGDVVEYPSQQPESYQNPQNDYENNEQNINTEPTYDAPAQEQYPSPGDIDPITEPEPVQVENNNVQLQINNQILNQLEDEREIDQENREKTGEYNVGTEGPDHYFEPQSLKVSQNNNQNQGVSHQEHVNSEEPNYDQTRDQTQDNTQDNTQDQTENYSNANPTATEDYINPCAEKPTPETVYDNHPRQYYTESQSENSNYQDNNAQYTPAIQENNGYQKQEYQKEPQPIYEQQQTTHSYAIEDNQGQNIHRNEDTNIEEVTRNSQFEEPNLNPVSNNGDLNVDQNNLPVPKPQAIEHVQVVQRRSQLNEAEPTVQKVGKQIQLQPVNIHSEVIPVAADLVARAPQPIEGNAIAAPIENKQPQLVSENPKSKIDSKLIDKPASSFNPNQSSSGKKKKKEQPNTKDSAACQCLLF